jgi:hypothetical protein
VLDFGGGPAPGPPTPGRLRHEAERFQDIAGTVSFDRQPDGAPLPGQGPHHLLVLRAEVGVGFQPAVAALLMLAQLPLPIMCAVGLLVATASAPGSWAGWSSPRRRKRSMPPG